MLANGGWDLTLTLLTRAIWRAPTNASKWRMGFNSAFKGLRKRWKQKRVRRKKKVNRLRQMKCEEPFGQDDTWRYTKTDSAAQTGKTSAHRKTLKMEECARPEQAWLKNNNCLRHSSFMYDYYCECNEWYTRRIHSSYLQHGVTWSVQGHCARDKEDKIERRQDSVLEVQLSCVI